jgi:hypothetical protein
VYADHGQWGRDRGEGLGDDETSALAGDWRACGKKSAMKQGADDLRTEYAIEHEVITLTMKKCWTYWTLL